MNRFIKSISHLIISTSNATLELPSLRPWGSVDLPFLIKSDMGWLLLKRVNLVIVTAIYKLLVETIPTRFYRLTCRNHKLVQSKPLQQRLFVLILGFWQCGQVFVYYVMSIILICKLACGYFTKWPLGIPLRWDLLWKRIDPKNFLFIGINN